MTSPEQQAREVLADDLLPWLIDQLEHWPTRVHPDRTTCITYLMGEAAKHLKQSARPALDREGVARADLTEHIARQLFVWDEREGGNTLFSVDSDSVQYWFSQGPGATGEDADCYRLCQDLRRQAAFILDAILATSAVAHEAVDSRAGVVVECIATVNAIKNPYDEHRETGMHHAWNMSSEAAVFAIRALADAPPTDSALAGEG